MSEMRIALVAEGPTDYEVISASLTAILGDRPFVLTLLQPEATQPQMDTGWGGVLKWCYATGERHSGSLDDDPTLLGYNLLIIHVDVDVSGFKYMDKGQAVVDIAIQQGWLPLPCTQPCPPPIDTVDKLKAVLKSWLGNAAPGSKTVLCLPAQASGSWLAAAMLPKNHSLRAGIECNVKVETGLAHLPKADKVKKAVRDFRLKAPLIKSQWTSVKTQCSQAAAFEHDILEITN